MKRLLFALIIFPALAIAGGKPTAVVKQSLDQAQDQSQTVNVNFGGEGGTPFMQDADTTQLSTGDTTIDAGDTTFNSENNSSNVVLVPNNNTESCMRVYGLSFGNKSGAGGIGWPYRSRDCDLEAAADDAFAQGNMDLGWLMKCKQKNMQKAFDGEQNCLAAALGKMSMAARIEELEQQRDAVVDECEHQKAVRDEATERCNQRYLEALGVDK